MPTSYIGRLVSISRSRATTSSYNSVSHFQCMAWSAEFSVGSYHSPIEMQNIGMPMPDYRRRPPIVWVDVAEKGRDQASCCRSRTDLHASAACADGRPGLIMDIGSVGKLARGEWLQPTNRRTQRHGRRPGQYGRANTSHLTKPALDE